MSCKQIPPRHQKLCATQQIIVPSTEKSITAILFSPPSWVRVKHRPSRFNELKQSELELDSPGARVRTLKADFESFRVIFLIYFKSCNFAVCLSYKSKNFPLTVSVN